MSDDQTMVNWRYFRPGQAPTGAEPASLADLEEKAWDGKDTLVIDTDVVMHVVRHMLAAFRRFDRFLPISRAGAQVDDLGGGKAYAPSLDPGAMPTGGVEFSSEATWPQYHGQN